MQKFMLLILLSIFFIDASAQNDPNTTLRFRGGMVLGLNASQVDGDDFPGYHKVGLNGGFLAEIPVSKKFFVSMEILYAQKGAKSRTYAGLPTEYHSKLDYAEVPILINFQEKTAVNFGLGFSYGRLVRNKEYVDELIQPTSDDFNRDDFCGVANGNYLISDHFRLNFRFAYSLVPIGHRSTSNFNNRGMYNNVLSFRLAYVL